MLNKLRAFWITLRLSIKMFPIQYTINYMSLKYKDIKFKWER